MDIGPYFAAISLWIVQFVCFRFSSMYLNLCLLIQRWSFLDSIHPITLGEGRTQRDTHFGAAQLPEDEGQAKKAMSGESEAGHYEHAHTQKETVATTKSVGERSFFEIGLVLRETPGTRGKRRGKEKEEETGWSDENHFNSNPIHSSTRIAVCNRRLVQLDVVRLNEEKEKSSRSEREDERTRRVTKRNRKGKKDKSSTWFAIQFQLPVHLSISLSPT